MNTFPFESFINLVRFDQDMKKLNMTIDKEQKALYLLQEQKKEREQTLDQLMQSVHDAQKEVDAKELDMKTLDEREADIKAKIDQVSSPKEYSSFKKELDKVQEKQRALEDALVAVWNRSETVQRNAAQKKDEMLQQIADAQSSLNEKNTHIEQLKERLHTQREQRPEKLKTIPEEWLEKYEGMHGRVDNPVVEVVQGGCGGCFYAIPDQDLLRLKRKALLQCNSCYRFLYDPSVLQAPSETE